MTSTPKKSTEAEDVLEFLNSLPENKDKGAAAFRAKSNKGTVAKDKEDVLDFLDELEKSDLRKDKKPPVVEAEKAAAKPVDAGEGTEKVVEEEKKKKEEGDINEEEEDDEGTSTIEGDFNIDPLSSLSNWWSSSGSSAVNSLWNNAKSIQQKASQEASKLANEATKKLGDEKENVERRVNAFKFLSENFESILNGLNVDQYDEFLKIHLIHDLVNFNGLEGVIKSQFKKVLKQVQGDIFIEVVKQGTVSKAGERRYSVGAHDGVKKLNLFEGGVVDGDKLNWANLKSSIQSTEKPIEKPAEKEKPTGDEKVEAEAEAEAQTDLNMSRIFIAVLAVHPAGKTNDSEFDTIDSHSPTSFQFRVILKDIGHNISIVSETQSFPIQWAKWIEYNDEKPEKKDSQKKEEEEEEDTDDEVDPAEWVKDWIDQGLALTIGVLAQEYVVKRMGF
jgi:hypothetical protein